MVRQFGIISLVLFAIVFAAACSTLYVPMVFEGHSMLPAYEDGDRLFVDTTYGALKRGDVIVHEYPEDRTKSYVKRVIGLPGETIAVKDGKVLIDGKPIREPYVDENYNQSKRDIPSMKVPADSYFVMGDNRDNSSDSRIWGPVKKEMVIGKVVRKF